MRVAKEVEHLLLRNKMAKESRCGVMVATIMAILRKESKRVKVSTSGLMEVNILDNG